MPEVIPGYDTQQKTVTVAATDLAMNDSISTEAADGWTVGQLVLNGTDMTILFTRTIAIEV